MVFGDPGLEERRMDRQRTRILNTTADDLGTQRWNKFLPKIYAEVYPILPRLARASAGIIFPMTDPRQRLKGLALSDTGFLFDPITGHMYSLNRTGSEILKWLRDGIPEHFLPGRIVELFDVTPDEAERDCAAFVGQLREFRLLDA